jgi:hypothetical protein
MPRDEWGKNIRPGWKTPDEWTVPSTPLPWRRAGGFKPFFSWEVGVAAREAIEADLAICIGFR